MHGDVLMMSATQQQICHKHVNKTSHLSTPSHDLKNPGNQQISELYKIYVK